MCALWFRHLLPSNLLAGLPALDTSAASLRRSPGNGGAGRTWPADSRLAKDHGPCVFDCTAGTTCERPCSGATELQSTGQAAHWKNGCMWGLTEFAAVERVLLRREDPVPVHSTLAFSSTRRSRTTCSSPAVAILTGCCCHSSRVPSRSMSAATWRTPPAARGPSCGRRGPPDVHVERPRPRQDARAVHHELGAAGGGDHVRQGPQRALKSLVPVA